MTRRRIAAFAVAAATTVPGLTSAPALGWGLPSEESAAADAQQQVTDPVPLLELVSAGGRGRLYTLDEYEARAAVSRYGMSRQPGRIGYLRRQRFDGSTPLFRLKRRADSTAWLFTASIGERDSLVAQGWIYEGVSGYLNRSAGPGLERLMRFGNAYEWRLAPESRANELLNAGYRLDGPVGYVHAEWTRVGAVYFGMFHAGGHERIIQRTKEVYGRDNDWWGGVRDFFDGHPNGSSTWPGTDFSDLKPSIGYYDDSQQAVLEKHIRQATSAGLDFFNFYWYWDPVNQREQVTGAALDAFLAARNRNAIDFNVGVCAHPFDSLTIPTAQFAAVAQVLVDKYLAQPNALRTNDGRKTLALCDARGIGSGSAADVKAFVDTVRARARKRLGEDIYVMISHSSWNPRQVGAAGGDAPYCVTEGPAVEQRSYQRYVERQRDFFAQAPGVAYGRCVMSDFDERPRYPIEQRDANAIRWFPDQTMDLYRQAVRNVRDDIASSVRPPEIDNLVFVYAWNEWHEGGVIEPNARDGCAYLDVLRAEFRLTSGVGCSADPAL